MTTTFTRLSVFWNDRQLDVSLPAHRPILDLVADVTELFHSTISRDDSEHETLNETRSWALSSPTKGILDPNSTLSDYDFVDGQQIFLTDHFEAARTPFVDDIFTETRVAISDQPWRWTGVARKGGFLSAITALGMMVYLPGLFGLFTSPTRIPDFTITSWAMIGLAGVMTLLFTVLALWQPLSVMRWLALSLPLTTAAAVYPYASLVPAGQFIAIMVGAIAAASILVSLIAGRKTSAHGFAGAVTFFFVALTAAALWAADFFGASMLAIAAWGAWVPILMLLAASGFAVRASGLAALLRQSSEARPVDRKKAHNRAVRALILSNVFVWYATIVAVFMVAVTSSSPYWQQGICAVLLSLVMLVRTNAYADARLITPLIAGGTFGLAITAPAIFLWVKNFTTTNYVHAPWWTQYGGDAWQPWAVFAGMCVLLMIILIGFMARTVPHGNEKASRSSVMSVIDAQLCIFSIPAILIAQGVLQYYWATT